MAEDFWRRLWESAKVIFDGVVFLIGVLSSIWGGFAALVKAVMSVVAKWVVPGIALWLGTRTRISQEDENTIQVSSVHAFTADEQREMKTDTQVLSAEEFRDFDFGIGHEGSKAIYEHANALLQQGDSVDVVFRS